jgi:multicomponent Na+:H+ antiporter subunit A
MILRVATDLIAPVLAVASVWLLLRGHDRVGGGFIGGLAAGAAIVLLYLSRGHEGLWQHRVLRTLPLVGVGLAITAASGLIGLALDGSYLAGGKLGLGRIEVARSLVFDVGLHVVVVALVVSVLRHLGQGLSELPPATDRGGPTERTRA